MRPFRTYNEVEHETGSGLLEQVLDQHARLAGRLARVGAIVAIVSGKGGVGKSFVTAGLASALGGAGKRVGVVDADLNGPSMARMLGVREARLGEGSGGIEPATGASGVRVISMELLQGGDDAPLRWRGPGGHGHLWQSTVETSALREFLGDVAWGELDLLLVDVPPGTDKIARLLELVPGLHAAVVVTTPGTLSEAVVARSLRLVVEAGVPITGLVSNMDGFRCPGCGEIHALFPGEGGEGLRLRYGLPLWASIPLDPGAGSSTDAGAPDSTRFEGLAAKLLAALGAAGDGGTDPGVGASPPAPGGEEKGP